MNQKNTTTSPSSDDALFQSLVSMEKKERSSSILYTFKQNSGSESEYTSSSQINTPTQKEYCVINLLNRGTLNLIGQVRISDVKKEETQQKIEEIKKMIGTEGKKVFNFVKKEKSLRDLIVDDEETRCDSDSELITERSGLFMDDSIEKYIKEQLGIKGRHLKKLKQWVGLSRYKIIYNSDLDEFTSKVFNQKIEGKHNISIIVITNEKWVFGCFNQLRIPDSNGNEEIHGLEDKGFFIFSIKNPHHTMPTKISQRSLTGKLLLFPNNSRNLFGVEDAFIISKHQNESFIFRNIEQFYSIPSIVGPELFTGRCYPDTFYVEKVFVIEWY